MKEESSKQVALSHQTKQHLVSLKQRQEYLLATYYFACLRPIEILWPLNNNNNLWLSFYLRYRTQKGGGIVEKWEESG